MSTPFFLFSSFIVSSSSSLFSSSSYSNYSIVMISSMFLDISLLFCCYCFSFIFFLPFLIQRSLFLFFSFLLHLISSFFLISVVSISTQFSLFISFAWFKFIIIMITMLFLFLLSSSISTSSFFLFSSFCFLPLLFLLPPFLFFFISQCDDFLNFPCHFLGAVPRSCTLSIPGHRTTFFSGPAFLLKSPASSIWIEGMSACKIIQVESWLAG